MLKDIEGSSSPIYDSSMCKIKLDNLLEKYANNAYITNKLLQHIIVQLPLILETANINHIKREERKQLLTYNQQDFTNKFLNIHNYFYLSNTEIFFNYDKQHFSVLKEDDIIHTILRSINHEPPLIAWKHKIKVNIIKKIKERNLFNCIPDSQTIQYVINNLYPSFFKEKNQVKYFLTIIGDIILKKNDSLIYLIDQNAKNLIKYLSTQCYNYCGNGNLINNFKCKYHEQYSYQNCRLLQINENNYELLGTEFNKNILDLFCVAVHYSNRYNSADEFLNSVNSEFQNYNLYLKNNSQENIVNNFIQRSLNKCSNSTNTLISFKDMIYLWKLFLDEENLPNIMYINTLKCILKDKLEYDEEKDNFLNLTSTLLPTVSNFINFWDETIIESEDENILEISELLILFKHWSKASIQIKENTLLDLIKYYYNDTIIENDKFICNIKCSLFNKNDEINKLLQELKIFCQKKQIKYSLAIDYAYDFYSKNCKKNLIIINKQYFEEYIKKYLQDYLDDDNLILPFWWQ